ncbi:MAG: SpaA isopeptide-forming pilin-related protein [Clostridia bacterium]|nr:SpaA isopeptide-forming pilin-related protein [Clostridia bacterium]
MKKEHKKFSTKIGNRIRNIKNFKTKIFVIILLMMLLSLQFTPFMLRATATQLPFYSPALITPATDVYYQKNVFFSNATLGGDTAYCIDYGKSLPSGTMSYYKQLSAQGVSILVYGYPNTSAADMGCASDDEAYMATQMAFWTVMMKTGESEGPQTFNLDNIYAKPGYEEFMQRAAAAAKRLNAKAVANPYVPNPSLTVNSSSAKLVNKNGEVITGPYVVNVTGGTVSSIKASLSNAPSSAKIVDANGNTKTTFANGESVYVAISENENGSTMTLNVSADTNKVVGSIYSGGDSSQNFVKLDTVPVELSASVNIKWGTQTGSIELYKVDQDDKPISGVKFELRDSNNTKVAEGTTGTDGYIKFSNVKVGNYKLVEISAPSGYIMTTDPVEFSVTSGSTYQAKFINEKIKGAFEITKVDENNHPIPNVTFELLNSNKEKLVEFTTNSEGKAKINNLSKGTYYYREIEAPINVIMDSTLREFRIESTNELVTKTVTNKTISGGLKIIKIDDTGSPIEGVKFQILNSNKSVVKTITTDANGIATLENLSIGTYYYKEISGPTDIVIDSNEYAFNINHTSDVITKEIVNNVAKAKIKITKNSTENTPISNVKFQILDSNKNVVDTITTDTNGIATSKDLKLGTYYYKEIEAPANVVMDTAEYEFKLTQDKQVLSKTVINEIVKEKLKIVKVDENDAPIAGVTFQILDSNKNVIEEITTGTDGIALSQDLTVGKTYYYKEISGPSNMIIDSGEYAFRVTENSGIITKKIVNKYKKAQLEIIKVDEENHKIAGVKFQILDSNKKLIETITTNEEGKATSSKLNLGTYYYKEIEAPENLILDVNEYEFKLTENNQILSKTVVNEIVKEKLKIIKVDENDKPISGVKFQILDSEKNIVEEIITGIDGIALSQDLTVGKTYYYKEISGPSNMIIDSGEYAFRVTENSGIITKKMVNEYKKAQLEIIKVDGENQRIAGVKFQILDAGKNLVETIITNEEGKAISSKLNLGTYYYKEVEAPGNLMIDTNEYEFKLTEHNQVLTKTVVNNTINGRLQIVKVNEERLPIKNAVFEILDEEKNIIDTITTDENGIATSKNLTIGKYYYREKSVDDRYVLDTKEYIFKIDESNELVTKKVINEYVKGSLKIIKTDNVKKPLSGVEFEILNENKEVVQTLTTGSDGVAISQDLLKGKYYYRETKAPEDVVIDTSEHIFVISENAQIIQKNIVNEYSKKGSIEILKVDEQNIPLLNIKFEILDSQKNVIEAIITNENGIAKSSDLALGTYYYREVETPPNIILDSNEYEFKITENGQVIQKTVVNQYEKRSLKIIKVDENDIPLEGIEFHILDENKNVIDTIVTDKNGIATSKELVEGKYYYQETKVPENIILDDKLYEFTVSKDDEIVIKNMMNYYKKGIIKITKLDEDGNLIEGVKFNILDSNQNIVETIITGSDGIATSQKLSFGMYYYQEIEVPKGLLLDNTLNEFVISENDQILQKTVVNRYEKGNLKIIKVDENNMPISGVKFEILDSNKNLVKEIVTGNDGIANISDLKIGTYYYKEVGVPEQYILDSTEYEFKISEYAQEITKTVVNKFSNGTLRIIKVDENNTPLEGVKFNILDSNKNLIQSIITNSQGIAESSDLKLGTYYYQEVEAPEHIIVDNTIYKFVVSTNNEVVIKTMVNKYEKGSLKIIKVDENNVPLSGVKFQILDSNKKLVDTVTTGTDGIAIAKELMIGTYYYKEISVPKGYSLDSTEYEFKISEYAQEITKTVVNRFSTGVLKIIKVDENDIPLEGIKFNILDSDKNVIQTIVTNSAGIAESDELKIGTYYYQEIEAPEHIIIDTTVYQFKITKDKEIVIKNLINQYEKSTLKIIKVDENNVPLEGIRFNILDHSKQIIDTITTNKEGIAESNDLTLGTYYYQEISVPNGIILDNNLYEFDVTEYGQIVIKNMINYFSRGKLEIIKVDTEDKVISGVKFKIFDSNKTEIEEIVTNEEGIARTSELLIGKYYYQEVEAPLGYVIDDKLYQFKITDNLQTITKKLVNKEVYGALKINKIDKNTKEKLKGVEFKILNSNREEIGTYTTDKDGIILVENLPYGEYYYKEMKTPENYLVDNQEYRFDIKKDDVVINKTITNQREKLPQTGGLISTNVIIVAIVTAITIIGYIIFNMLRDKKEEGNFKFKDDDFVDGDSYDDLNKKD